MSKSSSEPPKRILTPVGTPMTVDDLPPPETKRWVIRRKAEVVAAVRGGLISLEEACKRYTLTIEEFLSWQRLMERVTCPQRHSSEVRRSRIRQKSTSSVEPSPRVS